MKNVLLLLAILTWSQYSFAVCSNITRTNLGSGSVLTASAYNGDLNTVFSRANNLPGECLTDETVTTAKILNGTIVNADISSSAAIARSKLESPNYILAASDSGSFSTTSTSYVDITNQSVTITTIGRPVLVTIVNGDVTVGGSSTAAIGWVKAVRDSTDLAERNLVSQGPTSPQITVPGGAFTWIDTPSAGAHTYKLQAKANGAGITIAIGTAKIFVREL